MRHSRIVVEGSCGIQRPCISHPQRAVEPQLQVNRFTVVRVFNTKLRPAFQFPGRSVWWFLKPQKVRRGVGSDGEEMIVARGPSDELLNRGIEGPLVAGGRFDTNSSLLRDVRCGYIWKRSQCREHVLRSGAY